MTLNDKIGNYEILTQLNPERKSRIYKVQHVFTEEILALKLLFPDSDEQMRQMEKSFKKLSQAFSRIKHSQITNFKDFFIGELNGRKYVALVSEFFDGFELGGRLGSNAMQFSQVELEQVFKNVCEAVLEAHDVVLIDEYGIETVGFPHGSIIPSNILINREKQTKLLDFKLSNQYSFSEQKLKEGKYKDIVPEQRDRNTVSIAGDIFQLGFLLMYLFAKNRVDIPNLRLEEMDRSQILELLDDQYPINSRKKYSQVIFRATRKQPKDRFESVLQMFNEFESQSKSGLSKLFVITASIFCFVVAGFFIKNAWKSTNKNSLEIRSVETSTRGTKIRPSRTIPNGKGKYHALIFSNNEYQHLPKLRRPVLDADQMEQILLTRFGFKREDIIRVNNAKRNDFFDGFEMSAQHVEKDDHLLVFYAGHGQVSGEDGYWIPVEGRAETRRDWLSNVEIKKYFNSIVAKNILLISDACFGGSILRDINSYKAESAISNKKSRIALTSGSMESVPDNSVFIEQVFWYLENTQDSLIFASDIFSGIREGVVANTSTDPAYGPIREAGHQGGDFVLIRK